MPLVQTRIDLPLSVPIYIEYDWLSTDTNLGKRGSMDYGWISRENRSPVIRSITLAPEALVEIQSQVVSALKDPLFPALVRVMSELSGPFTGDPP